MFRTVRPRFTEFPVYEDITSLLDSGTKELEVGELLHTESFSLMEAMSVIEILDPKMDSGMNWQDTDSEQGPLSYDITTSLTTEQLLGILDQLFCCEQTWYLGYGLSHTLYICHYVHGVSTLPYLTTDNPTEVNLLGVLKAYIIATLHCSHLVWTEMIKGHIQDEEDFVTTRAGLPFYSDTTVLEAKDLLLQAGEWVKANKPEPLWSDLLTRLETRYSYLDALIDMSQSCCFKYPQAEKNLLHVSSLVPLLIFRASPPPGAFEPRIARTFNSNAPPRQVDILDLDAARSHFEKTLSELTFVCRSINYPTIWDLTYSLIHFSRQSVSPIARSWLCSTTYQDRQSFGHFGTNPIGLDHIEALCPWTRALYFQKDTLHVLNEFTKVFSNFMLHYYLMLCRNRPRQRRTMCKLISALQQLQLEASHITPFFQERLEGTIPSSEVDPTPLRFSSMVTYPSSLAWLEEIIACPATPKPEYSLATHHFPSISLVGLVERYRLSLMLEILTSGFPLELYASHEWAPVFHYISYILDCQIEFYLTVLGLSRRHQIDFLPWLVERIQADREVTLPARIILEYLQAQLNLHLASATSCLLPYLEQKGSHPNPFPSSQSLTSSHSSDIDVAFHQLQNDELRFTYRFAMFNPISRPSPLQFPDTQRAHQTLIYRPSHNLIDLARHQFDRALELASSLQALSVSHPHLFAASMCPTIPISHFTAIVTTVQANLTLLTTTSSDTVNIKFGDPTTYRPPWVPKLMTATPSTS